MPSSTTLFMSISIAGTSTKLQAKKQTDRHSRVSQTTTGDEKMKAGQGTEFKSRNWENKIIVNEEEENLKNQVVKEDIDGHTGSSAARWPSGW